MLTLLANRVYCMSIFPFLLMLFLKRFYTRIYISTVLIWYKYFKELYGFKYFYLILIIFHRSIDIFEQFLLSIDWLIIKAFQPVLRLFHAQMSWLIGLVGRVFANGPGDLGSIPGCVIQKTLKWYLIPTCLTLSNLRYGSSVKWGNLEKGVAPSPTPRCSSYWKGSLRVTLD